MGGKIAVGIIDNEGQLKTIEGWTNALASAVKNEVFAKGDVVDLLTYFDFYENDRGTQGYGPSDNTPSGYGYVLFDLREGNVLSAQGYTNFSSILGIEVPMGKENGKESGDGLARMISTRVEWNEEKQKIENIAVGPFSDAADFMKNPDAVHIPGGHGMSPEYKITYPAWNIADGNFDPPSFEAIRDYLEERNLLTPDELLKWNAVIEEMHAAYLENTGSEEVSSAPSM